MLTKPGMIGEFLMRAGLIDSSGLDRAQRIQAETGVSLGTAIASLGLATEDSVSAVIANRLQLETLSSTLPEIEAEISGLLPATFCQKNLVAPLSLSGNSLRLAMVDPLDYSAIQDVAFRTSKVIVPVVASQSSILALLNRSSSDTAGSQGAYEDLTGGAPVGEIVAAEDAENAVDAAKLAKDTKLAPVVRLVNLMLSGAAKAGASDVHVEPKEKNLLVRQRVDGLLQDVFKIPKHFQDATISRLKIISGMDISDRRRPQDGRSQLRFEGKRIDLRVSTLPTQFGEKVVIRLLDQSRAVTPIEKIDLTPENLRIVQLLLTRPQGMILVTGPTGSGKSSTLYTALNWVKSPTTNIITVEDPIEYQLDGVNQVQINTKAGVTFAKGLRSILRQDPNIILVGEIRDQETAGIALEAAQTGHLLLSTLHTNDAPATVSRLFDLGIEPFLVASALIGILAQRLVQRNCPFCSVPQSPPAETLMKLGGLVLPTDAKWLSGRGCQKCMQVGFKGRVAIHELLQVTDEVRALITARAPEHELRRAARAAGMRTLLEDGVAKAAQGLTTLDAVLQVVSPDDGAAFSEGIESRTTHVPDSRAKHEEPKHLGSVISTENPRLITPGEKERVLVVEDNRTISSVVQYFLELEGFEVLLAEDGLIGLKTAQREHPNVIVTDVNMPTMDGISMVKALRADPLSCDIAILMLTSEDSLDSETRALSAGADDYILKPVEPRRLAARVKALLARAKARQLTEAK
jgi:type IV pilus assembly protein PilB